MIIVLEEGVKLYVKHLSEIEKNWLKQRYEKIKGFQEAGVCFTCHDFTEGDIFPDEGLTIYEDDKIICKFEKYPRATGHTIIIAKEHYEDISEMPLELGTHILKIADAIIKLHKEILAAEKVYMCTICDGKRNHLHFQLLPRLKGETIGYRNFVREEGIIIDYHETVDLYKQKLKEIFK